MEPLKNRINEKVVQSYANELEKSIKGFSGKMFKDKVVGTNWEQRELMDRIQHIADSIHLVANNSYEEVVDGMEKAVQNLPAGFEQIAFPAYIKTYGLAHFDRSLLALERLTEYSTGEFAIRPFIKADTVRTMKKMLEWSSHKNEHVRRLSSEGCRPRLPWGGNLPGFIEDPELIFPILKNLRNDHSLYVRKSVANNLNDISKDHPETVLRIARSWQQENQKHTNWIIKHALRSLLKEPHPKALQLFGYGNPDQLHVSDFKVSNTRPKMGGVFDFSLKLKNQATSTQKIRAEYLIDFKKKKGSAEKVFQISEFELEGKAQRQFFKKHTFKELTTRKHYPGKHAILIRINGEVKERIEFELLD